MSDCWIVGGGSSLAEFDWATLSGRDVVSINGSWRRVPPSARSHLCYTSDAAWLSTHGQMACIAGVRVIHGTYHRWQFEPPIMDPPWPNFEAWQFDGDLGFSLTEGHLFTGHNSGYAAINLAYLLGHREIHLLGFDHLSERNTSYGRHYPEGKAHEPSKGVELMERWRSAFINLLAVRPPDLRIHVHGVNTTIGD